MQREEEKRIKMIMRLDEKWPKYIYQHPNKAHPSTQFI